VIWNQFFDRRRRNFSPVPAVRVTTGRSMRTGYSSRTEEYSAAQLPGCPSTANQGPSAPCRLTRNSQRRVEPSTYNNLQQHFCIFSCMSNSDLTSVLFLLLLLVGLAQLLGHLFVKLRQPKVIGEILVGIVLGPALLGRFQIGSSSLSEMAQQHAAILNFVYWMGLLLLMFMSGAETKQLFSRDERREVCWLAIVGAGIPFIIGLVFGPMLAGPAIAGPKGNRLSLVIILAVGVAVTSVPVISKIFADLRILHTRFAPLVLGVAVLEDIVLWAALAIATAVAGTTVLRPTQMAYHLLTTLGFFALGLTLLPSDLTFSSQSISGED
jgi:Kef-type K+ transport system membrane component KefB